VIWQTRSIAEAAATVSIFTMIFGVALSAVKLLQAPADAPETSHAGLPALSKREPLTAE
jgi:hypothetical protein